MKRLLALLITCCAMPAVSSSVSTGEDIAVDVTLPPKKVHEECVRLEAGQARRWHWKSSAPVDFNIHYHRGDDVFYPVKRDVMRGDGGTFAAKSGEDYCWMWTAHGAPAKVEGRISK